MTCRIARTFFLFVLLSVGASICSAAGECTVSTSSRKFEGAERTIVTADAQRRGVF